MRAFSLDNPLHIAYDGFMMILRHITTLIALLTIACAVITKDQPIMATPITSKYPQATTLAQAVTALGGESNALAVLNRHFKQKSRDAKNRETLKWANSAEGKAAREKNATKTA